MKIIIEPGSILSTDQLKCISRYLIGVPQHFNLGRIKYIGGPPQVQFEIENGKIVIHDFKAKDAKQDVLRFYAKSVQGS